MLQGKIKRLKFLCIAFFAMLFLLNATAIFAQKISATISRNAILIGEQVTLQLKLEMQDPPAFQLISWTPVADSANHITVVNKGKLDSASVNGIYDLTQDIILTSFDTGAWKIIPLKVELKNISTGKTLELSADSINIQILPVDISGMNDYHDIKDIIEVQVRPPYEKYILIGLLALATLIVIFLLWKKFKNKKTIIVAPKSAKQPYDLAMEQLEVLKKENPQTFTEIKSFYSKLTDICKLYISQVLPVQATHLTTDEMMVRLTAHLPDEKIRTNFFQLMRFADAIKFAKYFPPDAEKDQSIFTATQLIKHIDSLTQKPAL